MTRQSVTEAAPAGRDGWVVWLGVTAVALVLTMLFWGPLWEGGTLIGGDTFSYYFPQKTFLSDSLKRGEFPLWNPLVGAGYPIVAESQTGVLYPPTLLFYRFLDVQGAYSANQLFHYVAAFLGMWAVGRRYRLSHAGAMLAALIYVYGWFAPRICLEWAIIGGAYLPWCVWIVEGWLVSRRRRTLLWLAPVFGLFLLAGHFHLAFVSTLGLTAYVLLRCVFLDREGAAPAEPRVGNDAQLRSQLSGSCALPAVHPQTRWSDLAAFFAVLVTGYLLASVQLGPSLELMTRSQRQEFDQGNDPGYGHIPPWYLTQILSSWIWYLPESDPDQALFHVGAFAYPCSTNKVEAHLYFGMVPLLLVLGVVAQGLLTQRRWPFSRALTHWLIIGGLALLLATGWPFLVLKHFPGFGYFRGAGRYSILTAFAVALLAGAGFDQWLPRGRAGSRPSTAKSGLRGCGWLLIVSLTTWDLFLVSRWVTYAVMRDFPLIASLRETSEVRGVLDQSTRPVRLWSRGQNAATIESHSAYPVYLGLGPREYFDPQLATHFHEDEDLDNPAAVAQQVDWLRRNGVTHVLSFVPLEESQWSVRLVFRGLDQLLSRVWDRYDSPLYVYECVDAPGRVVDGQGGRLEIEAFEQTANRLALTVSPQADSTVVVRELAYPGWEVTVDGVPTPSRVVDSMYRGVDVSAGSHRIEWTYHPRSLWLGLAVSAVTLLAWVLVYRRANVRHEPDRSPMG